MNRSSLRPLVGVSACLMASFKAFSAWFGVERQAALNAAVMAAGVAMFVAYFSNFDSLQRARAALRSGF